PELGKEYSIQARQARPRSRRSAPSIRRPFPRTTRIPSNSFSRLPGQSHNPRTPSGSLLTPSGHWKHLPDAPQSSRRLLITPRRPPRRPALTLHRVNDEKSFYYAQTFPPKSSGESGGPDILLAEGNCRY